MKALLSATAAVLLTAWLAGHTFAADRGPDLEPVLLQMIRDDSIHKELKLSSDQIDSVMAFLPNVDGDWFRARNYPADRRRTTIDALSKQLKTSLADILQPNQIKRLDQLQRQALGTRMVLRDDIAADLNLTDDQVSGFVAAANQTVKEAAALNKQVFDGKLDGKSAAQQIAVLQKKERQNLAKSLTPAQSQKLPSLTGPTFNFSKVKRMYPMAPELESEGVTWLDDSPVRLEELRGKVVAIHFYAFQCINCQRNLPHYTAWHNDYADDGLVVIGIQTPETSAERSLERVKAAAIKEGIEYPVMLDAEESNWKSWHNTMWPTVYLIDKEGFLRRWWTGEMNWNGTPGEQQMRETVEMLLKE